MKYIPENCLKELDEAWGVMCFERLAVLAKNALPVFINAYLELKSHNEHLQESFDHWFAKSKELEVLGNDLTAIVAKLEAENRGIKDVLSMCDPREDYGEGMVCQFCLAAAGEEHKETCEYLKCTEYEAVAK